MKMSWHAFRNKKCGAIRASKLSMCCIDTIYTEILKN
jgi:hypothetical protein